MATLQEIVAQLETYNFECVAGPLELCADWHDLKQQLATLQSSYNELIMQVGRKFTGESRHETAKRYIREREDNSHSSQSGQSGQRYGGASQC
jgi:meiotically up-regulated gene 157 (Mug157) protein